MSPRNLIKYEFLTEKDVLPEKDLLQKAVALKRFEYSPLGKELKTQASAAEKKFQGLNKHFNPEKEEKPVTIKKKKKEIINESKIVYDNKYSFSSFKNVRQYSNISLESKYDIFLLFYHLLNELRSLILQKEQTKIRKKNVHKNVTKLYNTMLSIYFKEYIIL